MRRFLLLPLAASISGPAFCDTAAAQQDFVQGVSVTDAAQMYSLAIPPVHEGIWRARGWRRQELILEISRKTRPPLGTPRSGYSGPDLPDEVLQTLGAIPLVRGICGDVASPCEAGGAVMVGSFSVPVRQADGTYTVYFEASGDDSLRRPGNRTGFGAGWRIVLRKVAATWELVRVEMTFIT
jgi:hypothetical protein